MKDFADITFGMKISTGIILIIVLLMIIAFKEKKPARK
jgi:hypothetical protein